MRNELLDYIEKVLLGETTRSRNELEEVLIKNSSELMIKSVFDNYKNAIKFQHEFLQENEATCTHN